MLLLLGLAGAAAAAGPKELTTIVEKRVESIVHHDVRCDLVRLDANEALLLDGLATDDGRIALAPALFRGLRSQATWRESFQTLAHECWHQIEFLPGVEQPRNPSQLARLEGVADAAGAIITRWWCQRRACVGETTIAYPHYRPAMRRARASGRPLAWLRDYAVSSNRTRGRMWARGTRMLRARAARAERRRLSSRNRRSGPDRARSAPARGR